jgi:NAD(P)-dependent dehydrogenase (short-subunit alcohol dehydrogenase family)
MSNSLKFTPSVGSRLAIVGGCGGMGQALVRAALDSGLRVAVLDLQRSLEQAPVPEGVLCIPCDVSDEASVKTAFDRLQASWGALETLVNLVGYTGEQIPVRDMPTDEWDSITDTCLRGMFLVARAALPLLEAGTNPSIVLTSSTFGHRVVHSGYAPYAASKAGVVSLGKALATECAPRIRVNVVSPGVFQTPFLTGGLSRDERKTGLNMDKYPQIVPLGRLGDPAEIVGPILFLAGPAASYITGQVLHVNGGIWAP